MDLDPSRDAQDDEGRVPFLIFNVYENVPDPISGFRDIRLDYFSD